MGQSDEKGMSTQKENGCGIAIGIVTILLALPATYVALIQLNVLPPPLTRNSQEDALENLELSHVVPPTAKHTAAVESPSNQTSSIVPFTPLSTVGTRAGERITLTINGVDYAFRWCPPGTFMMGSPASEHGRHNGETQHQVTLTRGFWMLETEVTQAMWESVMGNNPSNFKGPKLPVEFVSWTDCQEFIQKLNGLRVAPAGYKFSLPTEAQWEYACRAGTTTAYHFGNTLTREQANFSGNQTRDVGSYPANAWGLRDMHGNVREWGQDFWGDYPSGAVTDPTGAVRGTNRVLRGGSWYNTAEACRSAIRSYGVPSLRDDNIGLRLSLVSESR